MSGGLGRRAWLATAAAVLGAAEAPARETVVVASKIDTEGALLGHVMAAVLRAHGVPVETRLQLGPTRILRQALLSGAVDLYPEYTGNAAGFFHRQGDPAWHDAQAAWRLAAALDAPQGIVWLRPAPADNGWGIAVNGTLAQGMGPEHHPIERSHRSDEYANQNRELEHSPHLAVTNMAIGAPATLADLARYLEQDGRLVLAASVEFVEAPDALPAFERAYGFRLRQEQLLMLAGGDTAATIRAASEGVSGVNAAMAYGTDGALDALGLRLLADPRHAQIVFQPAPVVRRAVLDSRPEIAGWLEPVFAALDLPTLRRLNGRIAAEGADPAQVARDWLDGLGRKT